jgi:hypothetical protein
MYYDIQFQGKYVDEKILWQTLVEAEDIPTACQIVIDDWHCNIGMDIEIVSVQPTDYVMIYKR